MGKPTSKKPDNTIVTLKNTSPAKSTVDDMYRLIVESMNDSIYIVDCGCRYRFANAYHLQKLALKAEQVVGRTYGDFHPAQQSRDFSQQVAEVMRTGEKSHHKWRNETDDRCYLRTLIPVVQADGGIAHVIVLSRDITGEKQGEEALKASEDKCETILENLEDGYLELDCEGNILFCNRIWLEMIGCSEDEFPDSTLRRFVDDETESRLLHIFENVYTTGIPFRSIDIHLTRQDGSRIDVVMSASLIHDTKEKRTGIRTFVRDVTERKKAEETIRRLAYHDSLTGLPNRLLFRDRLNMAIHRATRTGNFLAIMLLDLDKFKDINDTLGHHMGDHLLQAVGARLTDTLRKGDTVARMGGDEFLLLLPEMKRAEDCNRIAGKIVNAFQQPFVIDTHELHITTSIGIAIYPNDSENVDTLIKHADIAMYRAKGSGRNNFQHYSPPAASGR